MSESGQHLLVVKRALIGMALLMFGLTATAAAQSADQSLSMTEQSVVGSDITYEITVNNIGPSAATNAVITNAIPANTTFTSMTTPAGWSPLLTPPVGGTGTVTLTRASFPQGGISTFTLTITIDGSATPGTEITNTATISSDTPDPTPAGNTKSLSRFVGPVTNLSVGVSNSLPIQVLPSPGSEFSWFIGVSNATGFSSPANDVVLTVPVPAHTTFVSFTPPPGWVVNAPAVGGTGNITASPVGGTVPAGAHGLSFQLRFLVDADVMLMTPIVVSASITTSTFDYSPSDNTSSDQRLAGGRANLSISDATIVEGDNGNTNAVFTVNSDRLAAGTLTATYATFPDTAIAGSDYVAVNGTVSIPAGSLTATIEVPVAGNTIPQADRQFFVRLFPGPVNLFVLIADGEGVGTITDDDPVATYYFAEGATGSFFNLEIAIANPNTVQVEAELKFFQENVAPITVTRTLPPQSRTTVKVDDIPGLAAVGGVSTLVSSLGGMPLVVDRLMTWDDAGGYGGHAQRATASPNTRWIFAEGVQNGSQPQTGGLPYFDTFLLLTNPGTTATKATVRFLRENEGVVTKEYDLDPNSRVTVYCGDEPELVGRSFGMDVTAPLPILAERSTYFGAARLWDGGHSSPGVTAPSTSWFHAEGATGPFFETFLTLANPGIDVATVTLTFLRLDGVEIAKEKLLFGGTRRTFNIEQEDPELANAAVSTVVTSNRPIVSERVMYWPDPATSWNEAHSTLGVESAGLHWGVADGRKGLGPQYTTYLLLANPNADTANVRVRFLRTSGAPIDKFYDIDPRSRFNVDVTTMVPELADELFSTEITVLNNQPIVVEEALYWNALGVTWSGGAAIPATRLP